MDRHIDILEKQEQMLRFDHFTHKDGTLVGVVTVSNLYHIADHEFVTQSLREYLNCPECPEYPYTIPE